MQFEPEALSILVSVNQFLSQKQIPAYLVGGFIRDTLLGRSTADIDVAIAEDALKIASEMADIMGGTYVPLDENNRIARVVLSRPSSPGSRGHWYVDLSTLIGSIRHDLGRRDFTINSMAIELKSLVENPSEFKILDPFKGQQGLDKHLIQSVSKTTFESDPARLLRAVRLAAELDFTVSPETEGLIRRHSALISRVAGERIREELLRILSTNEAGHFIRWMDELGLLTSVIPELEPSRGMEQPKEHHWDVLNHSIETVRAADFLLRRAPWEYSAPWVLQNVPWSEKLDQHFRSEIGSGNTRASTLKLAALLHDIAKPETKILTNERIRFFGHTEQGAAAAAGILERLRFSNKEIKLVELMVRYHLRPTQMSHTGMPTPRAIYRYFRDTGTAGIDILFLSLADHLAARGPDLDREQWEWHTGQVNFILTECFRQEKTISPPRLIDGHDLINLFGLKPGPRIREILESVREAQAADEIDSREQALSYVKNRLL